jgi:acetylornithine/succinyldiaminopimelate/putrescine aminotransferase
VCAAASAVCDALDDDLLENVRARSEQLRAGLPDKVRGAGLLLGLELYRMAAEVVDECRERGLIVLSAGETVLRLAPPLTVTEAEVDLALSILQEVLG